MDLLIKFPIKSFHKFVISISDSDLGEIVGKLERLMKMFSSFKLSHSLGIDDDDDDNEDGLVLVEDSRVN